MYVPRYTVTPTFRAKMLEEFPALGEDEAYWRLLGVFLFGGAPVEEETERLRMGQELLAHVVGGLEGDRQYARWRRGNDSGLAILEAFSKAVIPLKIGDYSYMRERTVEVQFPPHVEALARAERRDTSDERVWLDDGKPLTEDGRRSFKGRRRDQARTAVATARDHPAERLLQYLNVDLPSNAFSRLIPHLDEAHALLDQLGLSPAATEQQHGVLRSMELDARPYYRLSHKGDSTRVWPADLGLLTIKREIRVFMAEKAGWMEADLRAAQLAIVSAPPPVGWDVPRVRAFLQSGTHVWTYLADALKVDAKVWKPFLKERLYAVCYGEGNGGRRHAFAHEAPRPLRGGKKRFEAIPLVSWLLEARQPQLERIRWQRGARDAFGTWLAIDRLGKQGQGVHGEKAVMRSILSMQAQSWELSLLSPVLDLATSTAGQDRDHGFTIALWQHDGFSVRSPNSRDLGTWKRKIDKAVSERCAELSVPTRLKWAGGSWSGE